MGQDRKFRQEGAPISSRKQVTKTVIDADFRRATCWPAEHTACVGKNIWGDFVLLGALAGAKNDVCGANSYLNQACCQMPNLPLPMTMAAQVYAQAGDFDRAKALHCRALKKVGNVCRSPALAANSYMDLAVVYAQSGDMAGALGQLKRAESLLLTASKDPAEAALGWRQMGIVYANSIDDDKVALAAWQNGSAVLENVADESEATLKIDLDVRVADELSSDGQHELAAVYLESASRAIGQLSADNKPETQFQIGSSYVELAAKNPDNNTYSEEAAEQLAALTDQTSVPPAALGTHRDAALAYAKLLKDSDPKKAEQLVDKARQWTLEIGEMDSAYEPVFSQPSQSLIELKLRLSQHIYASNDQ